MTEPLYPHFRIYEIASSKKGRGVPLRIPRPCSFTYSSERLGHSLSGIHHRHTFNRRGLREELRAQAGQEDNHLYQQGDEGGYTLSLTLLILRLESTHGPLVCLLRSPLVVAHEGQHNRADLL